MSFLRTLIARSVRMGLLAIIRSGVRSSHLYPPSLRPLHSC